MASPRHPTPPPHIGLEPSPGLSPDQPTSQPESPWHAEGLETETLPADTSPASSQPGTNLEAALEPPPGVPSEAEPAAGNAMATPSTPDALAETSTGAAHLSEDAEMAGSSPEASPPVSGDPAHMPADESGVGTWARIGGALKAAGMATARGAVWVGQQVSQLYHTIDPDLRRHMAQLPLMGLTMLSPRHPPVAPLPDDGQRVVVFVHGLGGHRGNFLPMQTWFRAMGRRRTYAVGFSELQGIEEAAGQLVTFLQEVISQNQLPEGAQLEIVAHSMGGLISRLAVEHPSLQGRVASLITLGTPHSGTYTARFLQSPLILELRPRSSMIDCLQAQVPWTSAPDRPRLVAFWSASDLLLIPPEAGRLEGAENVEMNGYTHFSYLLNPQSWQCVLEALRGQIHPASLPPGPSA